MSPLEPGTFVLGGELSGVDPFGASDPLVDALEDGRGGSGGAEAVDSPPDGVPGIVGRVELTGLVLIGLVLRRRALSVVVSSPIWRRHLSCSTTQRESELERVWEYGIIVPLKVERVYTKEESSRRAQQQQ